MKCITLQVLTIKWLNKHSEKTLWWRLYFANGIQNPKLCVDRSMICNSILRSHWGKFRITVAINVCICGKDLNCVLLQNPLPFFSMIPLTYLRFKLMIIDGWACIWRQHPVHCLPTYPQLSNITISINHTIWFMWNVLNIRLCKVLRGWFAMWH